MHKACRSVDAAEWLGTARRSATSRHLRTPRVLNAGLPEPPAPASGPKDESPKALLGAWGLGEAGIAWVGAQLIGAFAAVGIVSAGGWSFFTPARPGGHLGRAAGQIAAGSPLENDSIPVLVQLATLLPSWLVLLGLAWFTALALGRDRPGWRIRGSAADVPAGVIAGLLLQIPLIPILYLLIEALFGELPQSVRAQTLVDQIDTPLKVVAIYAFVAVGAPVVEELFYRGLVQRALVDRFGAAIGIGVASLIFGAVHLSWIELPALTLVGLVLGVLHWKTKNLIAPIVAHMTFNAFTLTFLLAA